MRRRNGRTNELGTAATLPRLVLLAPAMALLMAGFVGLVNADNHFDRMWPWWLIGLAGLVLVLLVLGRPHPPPKGDRQPSPPSNQA